MEKDRNPNTETSGPGYSGNHADAIVPVVGGSCGIEVAERRRRGGKIGQLNPVGKVRSSFDGVAGGWPHSKSAIGESIGRT